MREEDDMHVEKVKLSAASGGILEHDFRYDRDGLEHPKVKHPDLTSRNVMLCEVKGGAIEHYRADEGNMRTAKRRVRAALGTAVDGHRSSSGRKPKSNAVGLISTVVTLPYDWPDGTDPMAFFDAARMALNEYYEVNGLVSEQLPAAVHFDEQTPHMHDLRIPCTAEGRLDANSILTRAFYAKLHPYVQQRVTELTGVECHVLLDADDAERRALSYVPHDELDAAVRGLTRKARHEAARAALKADKRTRALDAREAALNAREAALDKREAVLAYREQQREPNYGESSDKTLAEYLG